MHFLGIFLLAICYNLILSQSVGAETLTSDQIKVQYQLTDEEIKLLEESSVSHSQRSKVAQLAKSSGKSIDEVLKMRTEQKMGWGKIAKALGVDPKEIGHSVADSRREAKMERRAAKAERKARQTAIKEKRNEAKKNK